MSIICTCDGTWLAYHPKVGTVSASTRAVMR